MTIIGKKIIKETIIPAREVEERICDICGVDATSRPPCQKCRKDLCGGHIIDVHGLFSGQYQQDKEISGIYCKECLIAEIIKEFK